MPRKTKDQTENNNLEKEKNTKATAKKSSAKSTTKKAPSKKAQSAKSTEASVKTSTSKNASASKKSSASARKTSTSKNSSTKSTIKRKTRAVSKKDSTTSAKKSSTKVKALPIVEYYDLPYRYNQTIVKLLAQTPTNLFVYWDISDNDRENYKKTYGENFFEETKPVLIIHNNTLNYSFEVEINDFANSWYVHVNDSKCDYNIELGRRPIPSVSHINTDYIYVSSSNDIESPNDKILFNNNEHTVYFRNVKTNVTTTKSISFIRNMGKIYNIYDLYKTIYKDELQDNMLEDLSSSTFK